MAFRSLHQLGRRAAFSTVAGTSRYRTNLRIEHVVLHSCHRTAPSAFKPRSDLTTSQRPHFRHCSPFMIQSSQAYPASIDLSLHLNFDKVPDKLPDWWDDEEDDDDDVVVRRMKGIGGSGNTGGGEGGGGGGYGNNGGNGGGGGKEGFFAALLAFYVRAVNTNPVRTKAISTALLSIIGDYVAQQISQRDSPDFALDLRRTLSIGLWGFVFIGPSLHYWYAALDRLFFGRFAVFNKVLCDQLFFSTVSNAAFFAGVGTLEGNPIKESIGNLRENLWPCMKANWTLWPAAQVINFAFVPKNFQIVYVNCVALIWSAMLAYIVHDTET